MNTRFGQRIKACMKLKTDSNYISVFVDGPTSDGRYGYRILETIHVDDWEEWQEKKKAEGKEYEVIIDGRELANGH